MLTASLQYNAYNALLESDISSKQRNLLIEQDWANDFASTFKTRELSVKRAKTHGRQATLLEVKRSQMILVKKLSRLQEAARLSGTDPSKVAIQFLDALLMNESHVHDVTSTALTEAVNKEDLESAKKVIQKLRGIYKIIQSDAGFEILSDAIKEAVNAINSYTGGGAGSLIKKLGSMLLGKAGVKNMDTNPIMRSLTLVNSLEAGFGQLKDIVQNIKEDVDWKSTNSLSDLVGEDQVKILVSNLKNSFVPEGGFSALKGVFGTDLPFVSNSTKMISDMVKTGSVATISQVIEALSSGERTDAIAPAVVSVARDSGVEVPPTATVPAKGRSVGDLEGLAAIAAAGMAKEKGGDVGSEVASAGKTPKKFLKSLVKDISDRSGEDKDIVKMVIKALLKKNLIKSNLSLKTEGSFARGRYIPSMVLKLSDVYTARNCLIESNGDMNKFALLLAERILTEQDKEKVAGSLKAMAQKAKETKQRTQDALRQADPKDILSVWKGLTEQYDSIIADFFAKYDEYKADDKISGIFQDLEQVRNLSEEKVDSTAVSRLFNGLNSLKEAIFSFAEKKLKAANQEEVDQLQQQVELLGDLGRKEIESLQNALEGEKAAGEAKSKQISELEASVKSLKDAAKTAANKSSKKDAMQSFIALRQQLNSMSNLIPEEMGELRQESSNYLASVNSLINALKEFSDPADISRFMQEEGRPLITSAIKFIVSLPEKLKEKYNNANEQTRAQIDKLASDLSSKTSELDVALAGKTAAEEALKGAEQKAVALAQELEGNKAALNKFATAIGIDPADASDENKLQAAIQKLLSREPEAVVSAAEESGVTPPAVPAGNTGKPRKEMKRARRAKLNNLYKKIQDDLGDLAFDEVLSVLDSIPKYLVAEAQKLYSGSDFSRFQLLAGIK